jgi:hypothetical protein
VIFLVKSINKFWWVMTGTITAQRPLPSPLPTVSVADAACLMQDADDRTGCRLGAVHLLRIKAG